MNSDINPVQEAFLNALALMPPWWWVIPSRPSMAFGWRGGAAEASHRECLCARPGFPSAAQSSLHGAVVRVANAFVATSCRCWMQAPWTRTASRKTLEMPLTSRWWRWRGWIQSIQSRGSSGGGTMDRGLSCEAGWRDLGMTEMAVLECDGGAAAAGPQWIAGAPARFKTRRGALGANPRRILG